MKPCEFVSLTADKYFLRSRDVIKWDCINSIVKYRFFIRKSCRVYGVDEAIRLIKSHYSPCSIRAVPDGYCTRPCETIMEVTGPVQELISLETAVLGIISYHTTMANGGKEVNPDCVYGNMRDITNAVRGRDVIYMGARHWHWRHDKAISKACFDAGAVGCSTDLGASSVGKIGVGTIPHALEAVMHYKYGLDQAVVKSIDIFNDCIYHDVPRVALVDYAGKEIDDSLACAKLLGDELYGVRIDTCGERYMQGVNGCDAVDTYYNSKGVCIDGVRKVREALDSNGFHGVKIILSSGFANIDKVNAFVKYEELNNVRLFDALGVGQVYDSIACTGDIVEVEGKEIHKVGREAPEFNNSGMEEVDWI